MVPCPPRSLRSAFQISHYKRTLRSQQEPATTRSKLIFPCHWNLWVWSGYVIEPVYLWMNLTTRTQSFHLNMGSWSRCISVIICLKWVVENNILGGFKSVSFRNMWKYVKIYFAHFSILVLNFSLLSVSERCGGALDSSMLDPSGEWETTRWRSWSCSSVITLFFGEVAVHWTSVCSTRPPWQNPSCCYFY